MAGNAEIVKNGLKAFAGTDGRRDRRLADTLIAAFNQPERVVEIAQDYYKVAEDLLTMPPEDLALIAQINKKLGKSRGADTFRMAMAGKETMIKGLLAQTVNPESEVFKKAVNELGTRMDRARVKRENFPKWAPKDGDPESDDMIWGQTNGAADPWIDIHFMICHLGEQLCNTHMKESVPYCGKKDWSFATTDVIIYYGLQGKEPEKSLLDMWRILRPEGLGWARENRINATARVLREKGKM